MQLVESGAILQYLASVTGKFGGETEREKVEVTKWLFWQVCTQYCCVRCLCACVRSFPVFLARAPSWLLSLLASFLRPHTCK